MGLTDYFSSWASSSTVYADEAPADSGKSEDKHEAKEDKKEDKKEGGEEGEKAEEEDEPEDLHPAIKEECAASSKCRPFATHFEHCQEKIQEGKGTKHEDCVEEILMHCVDNCSAPKLFSKLQ